MRTLVLALIAFFALAGSAWAGGDPQNPPDDHSVTISPVPLPVVAGGQVVNYVFVTAKLMLNPRVNELAIRDKEPFLRDALVRDAYRTPFLVPGDYNRIDEGKLRAALYRDATAIAGQGAIRGVVVVTQTAQRFVPTPPAAPL